jgi:hypothetical protein
MRYNLLDELKDIVTGFTGVVLGRTEYATGCTHYGLQSKDIRKDGVPIDWLWYDESRLVSTGKKVKTYRAPNTSGPSPNAPQM